jgi:hypothetical protein
MATDDDGDGMSEEGWQLEVETRLVAVEQALTHLAGEVRTRRLVIDDPSGPRIVGEVRSGTAELRVEGGAHDGGRPAVVLFANPTDRQRSPAALAAGVGVQLWARGDSIGELDASPDTNGRWHPHLHLSGDD